MPKHRGHGEGTIYQRKDGRWCAAVTVGRDAKGRLKRRYVYGRSRREVQDTLAKLLVDQRNGADITPQRQTLGEFLERWLEDTVRPAAARNTYDNYKVIVHKHLLPVLGALPLAKLAPQHLQRLYREKQDSGLTRTVRLIHAVLHRALGQAVRWGLVQRNVADMVDVPRVARREQRALDQAELARFLGAAREDRLYALYLVAVAAGLRMGEVLGLRWDDVDFDRGVLHVRHNLQWFNDGPQLTELKTAKSRRVLVLPPTVMDALRMHLAAQQKEREAAGAAWREQGFVFSTGIGTPLNPSGVRNRSFRRVLERAELPRIRFHDLRHTMATQMLHAGENPKVVQEMLGHSTIQMTMNTYAHVISGAQRAAAARMEGILRVAADLPKGPGGPVN